MGTVLFLTARVGLGHTRAAAAIAAELRERGIESEIVDSYRYAASVFASIVADGYIGMVKTIPQMYRVIYERAERASGAGAARRWLSRRSAHNLRALVEERRPDVVVCTHAFPCGVMAAYKRYIAPQLPVVGVVTDYVVHPYWMYDNVDRYAVATPEMLQALATRGIDAAHAAADGIPVDARFGTRDESRFALRCKLGLPVHRPTVLVMGGGLGLGPIDAMVDALGAVEQPLSVVVLAGTNVRGAARLRTRFAGSPHAVRVVDFVHDVHDWMHAADVLLTKPGGLTCAEALAAELPMILVRPLPGQEERNARYLVERGAALAAADAGAVAGGVRSVLDDAATRASLRAGMALVRRPDAARTIAARIAALAAARAAERAHPALRAAPRMTSANVESRSRLRVERWPSG